MPFLGLHENGAIFAIKYVDTDPAFSASGNPFYLPSELLAIKSMLSRNKDPLQYYKKCKSIGWT